MTATRALNHWKRATTQMQQSRAGGGVIAALVLAAVLAAWAVIVTRASPEPKPAAIGPITLSADSLRAFAESVRQPIYWAGARPGDRYELTRTSTGNVFVRYLSPGSGGGSAQLTVATYPYVEGFRALESVSNVQQVTLERGGVAIVDPRYLASVYFAFPGANYQGQVFGPSPDELLRVVRSGDLSEVR